MKILIMDTVKPVLNDVKVHRWELIRHLAKTGQYVYVIAHKNIEFEGVYTSILGTEKGVFRKIFSELRYIILLFKLAMTYRFDILYTRNGLTGVIGSIAKIITRSKMVFELNAISSYEWELIKKESKINLFKKIKGTLLIRIEIFALKKSDAIIAVTQGIKNYLVNHGIRESKVVVIENGANTDSFKPIDDPAVLQKRCQYGINENAPIVMFVGYLTYWQGVEYLIQSAPLVLKVIPNIVFLIVGDGELKNKLINLAKNTGVSDKCVFTGNVPYKEVPLFINMADVCIVPKKIMGFGYSPLKLYEYMACGKPVIATNTTGFEILEKYNAGTLVNPENPHEFSGAIVKLLQNKQLREQMGANGRKLVVKEYSWENTAKKTIEVFRNLLK